MSAFDSYVGDSGPSFLSYLDGAGSGESSTAAAAAPPRELRVVSWNVGLRGLEKLCKPGAEAELGPPDVHGIRRKQSYGSLAGVLGALDADVVCLQEVKMVQLGALERAVALADGWESYFALNRPGKPYAGVATFCRTAVRPHAAEEGLTGVHAPPSGGVGFAASVAHELTAEEMRELDGEGRCVITLHGDLAILNLYVPAVTGEAGSEAAERRAAFKQRFLRALEARCRGLRAAGLRVLAIGDFNIAPAAIDRAMEAARADEAEHEGRGAAGEGRVRPSRAWLRALLRDGGDGDGNGDGAPFFGDCFRMLHPRKEGAYSCFHVASGADQHNWGSRIDLALVAPPPAMPGEAGSLRLLACDIRNLEGSDHLPIGVRLGGVALPAEPPPPLPLASRARLGGQAVLSSFMVAAPAPAAAPPPAPAALPAPAPPPTAATARAPTGLQAYGFAAPQQRAPAAFQAAGSFQAAASTGAPSASGSSKAWSDLFSSQKEKVPCCRGHVEKCVVRVVKKEGPNRGRTFYTCARADGDWPKNQEANCGFFQWKGEAAKRKGGPG